MESYNQVSEMQINLLQLKKLSEIPVTSNKDGFVGYDDNNIYFAINGTIKNILLSGVTTTTTTVPTTTTTTIV